MGKRWKRGRGKLGVLAPLLGAWIAESDSPRGRLRCRRELEPILGGSYVRVRVRWELAGAPAEPAYEELALIGVGEDGLLRSWSFTSDGKRSEGVLADASDVHAEALGFEAEMPAGRARQAYWPDDEEGFHWAVESRTKRGWNRFVEHHYRADETG